MLVKSLNLRKRSTTIYLLVGVTVLLLIGLQLLLFAQERDTSATALSNLYDLHKSLSVRSVNEADVLKNVVVLIDQMQTNPYVADDFKTKYLQQQKEVQDVKNDTSFVQFPSSSVTNATDFGGLHNLTERRNESDSDSTFQNITARISQESLWKTSGSRLEHVVINNNSQLRMNDVVNYSSQSTKERFTNVVSQQAALPLKNSTSYYNINKANDSVSDRLLGFDVNFADNADLFAENDIVSNSNSLPLKKPSNYSLSSGANVLEDNLSSYEEGMLNVVSMSLYGSEPRYTQGVLRNAQLVKQNFPGWRLWVYMDSSESSRYGSVPASVKSNLIDLGADIHYVTPDEEFIPPMMWRFLVADDPAVDRFIVRDSDSRLTKRDAASVAAWIRSDRPFHCIRDHPSHAGYALSGGLWGGRARPLRRIIRRSWSNIMRGMAAGYLDDMNFLNSEIWPRVEKYVYCSDSVSCDRWTGAVPFPVARKGNEHVGQVYDENDVGRSIDIKILKHFVGNSRCSDQSQTLT